MPVAIRAITRLQDADDVNVTPAVGVDEYALTWDNNTAKFVLRAPFAGLLATGETVGATSQAQAFTLGVVSPFVAPAADGTTAWQVRKADKTTAVVTVDTTNARMGIGTSAPSYKLDIDARGVSGFRVLGYSQDGVSDTSRLVVSGGSGYGSVDISPTTFSVLAFDRIDLDARSETFLINIRGQITSYNNTNLRVQPQSGYNILLAPSGGGVGIGMTTAPATALHVVGAATITGGIRPAADSTTALQLQNAAGTSVLNVDTTNGRVGIGTSAPGSVFQIDHAGPIFAIKSTNASLYSILRAYNSSANYVQMSITGASYVSPSSATFSAAGVPLSISTNGNLATGGTDSISLRTGGYENVATMVITAGNPGLVGIGTTVPATRLDIDAGALTMKEMTAPTGVADKAMLYTKDNGSGKTQLCCKLGDNVEIVLATQA